MWIYHILAIKFQFYWKTSYQPYAKRKIGLCPWLFMFPAVLPTISSCPGFKKEKSHGSCPVPVWRPCCVFILTAAGTLVSERSSFNLLETETQKSQGAGHSWVTTVSPAPWSAGHFPVLLIFLPCYLLALFSAPPPPPKKSSTIILL